MRKFTLILVMCITTLSAAFAQDWEKVLMIGTNYNYSDLIINGDDDEIAAAKWLSAKGGTYVGVEQIWKSLNGVDNLSIKLDDYKTVWIHLDKQGPTGIDNFREAYTGGEKGFLNESVLNALTDYYKNGGNLLLTTHGSILLKDLGRMDRYPEVTGFGNGGSNDDTWDINVLFGTWTADAQAFDRSGDPLFKDIEIISAFRPAEQGGREYKIFHLEGPAWKEDHNCFWHFDLPENNDNGNPAKYQLLYEAYGVTPLAIWPHITDYYGGGMARWDAKDDYKGKCITIGMAAYEWNQNSGENIYRNNIEKLTENALAELAPAGPVVSVGKIENDPVLKTSYYTLQGVEVVEPYESGIYIVKATYQSNRTEYKKQFIIRH